MVHLRAVPILHHTFCIWLHFLASTHLPPYPPFVHWTLDSALNLLHQLWTFKLPAIYDTLSPFYYHHSTAAYCAMPRCLIFFAHHCHGSSPYHCPFTTARRAQTAVYHPGLTVHDVLVGAATHLNFNALTGPVIFASAIPVVRYCRSLLPT